MARGKQFTEEFKRDSVALVHSSPERPVAGIARELGINAETLRTWVRQARVDAGEDRSGALTTVEREELRQLRREVAELRKEKEILRRAAAYFAQETIR